jgi:hypothetical protein
MFHFIPTCRQKARERDRERKWQRRNAGRRDRIQVGHSFLQTYIQTRLRDPSVDVRASWTVVEEIEFSKLSKLTVDVDEPTDLKFCGSAEQYDHSFDKINTKTPRYFGLSICTHA